MSENIEYEKIEESKNSYKKQLHWNMAIGLQQVDGLTPSDYLKELVSKNVEGKITNYEVEESLHNYYKTKDLANKKVSNEQECDLVATRIVELFNDNSFSFRPITLKVIHEYLFKGIYDFAGKFREYNISKDEPILKNETVNYSNYNEIEKTLEYDFKEEIAYDYSKLSMQEQIERLVLFTSRIWQVHPFGEGNTRTVAVMVEKYLRSQGYVVNNDLFKENSLYFRNALVRSNYSNRTKNIYPSNKYLIKFFANLLDNKKHKLDNNDLLIGKE
jgi:Protein involved in cell division